jgi:DNA invertase Pin-like site-specific DNA recombinase
MKFVCYYRVSTQGQENGIQAQRASVQRYLSTLPNFEILADFEEIESGKNSERPQLKLAIQMVKTTKATLLIAKLDRLARKASFLLKLQDSGIDFRAADLPFADKFTVGVLALVAQKEAEMCSERTKAGLAVVKAKGVKLGNPNAAAAWNIATASIQRNKVEFAKIALKNIQEIQATGITSLKRVAECLNLRGLPTRRTGGRWTGTTVQRVLQICS